MPLGFRLLLVVAAAVAAAATSVPRAQQQEFTNNFKYLRGQSIQPIFEGWSWAPDGSINMHFGYLNRNYADQPHIPVGPNNRFEPAGPDRGQPTFFYARTHRNLFTVNVPKSFGMKDEVVWTVTYNGQSERAVGWRQVEWEIDPAGGASQGGSTDPERLANKPPSISIEPVPALGLPATTTLVGVIADDGLPTPRPRRKPPVGQETPPTLQGGTEAPVNVPLAAPRVPPATSRPLGMVVTWMVWRGPAEVTFEPHFTQPADGRSRTSATFPAPGDYVLRASADDGAAVTHAEVKVTVSKGPGPAGRR